MILWLGLLLPLPRVDSVVQMSCLSVQELYHTVSLTTGDIGCCGFENSSTFEVTTDQLPNMNLVDHSAWKLPTWEDNFLRCGWQPDGNVTDLYVRTVRNISTARHSILTRGMSCSAVAYMLLKECTTPSRSSACKLTHTYEQLHSDIVVHCPESCAETVGCTIGGALNYDAFASVLAIDQYNDYMCHFDDCRGVPYSGCNWAGHTFTSESTRIYPTTNEENCKKYRGIWCTVPNTTHVGCMDPQALNYVPEAMVQAVTYDNISTCKY